MSENRLGAETSPYLLQHKDNAVHWWPWCEEALQEAKASRKPILISIGYAACHWCHVMAHESFEDAEIAELMNRLFVNIKIDREERPDLDAQFQAVLALLRQPGGWPLTMFLTPEGEPFWGGTYFPPEPRYGRPGFGEVLEKIAEIFSSDPERIEASQKTLREHLMQLEELPNEGKLSEHSPLEGAATLLSQLDWVHGGFGEAPKFPHMPGIELLWRAWRQTKEEQYRDAVCLTLERMANGGIFDHLGGGFSRYCVDAAWLVPHFEKMLYDNAAILKLFTLVWREERDPLLDTRISETIDFILREMRDEKGGFWSSYDADSEGEEGKYYVWEQAEIDALLKERSPSFCKAYGVTKEGNWESRNILNLLKYTGDLSSLDIEFQEDRTLLREQREKRVKPGLDDKILTDWNGLMISSLAEAGAVFEKREWLEAARNAFEYILSACSLRDSNDYLRLVHSICKGREGKIGFADDYAALARAALSLYEAIGGEKYLEVAAALVKSLDAYYWIDEPGGYAFTPRDGELLLTRQRHARDDATPSANGLMLGVLARLYFLTGEERYRKKADQLIAVFGGRSDHMAQNSPVFLNEFAFYLKPKQIILIPGSKKPAHNPEQGEGIESKETLADFRRAIYASPSPNLLIQEISPGETLPPHHPAYGKMALQDRPTAYVCQGRTCLPPITSAEELRRHLLSTKIFVANT